MPLLGGVAVAPRLSPRWGLEARLKWPNDVLVGERKLAGILAEASSGARGIEWVVLGIGVNVDPQRGPAGARHEPARGDGPRDLPARGRPPRSSPRLRLWYHALATGRAADLLAAWRERSIPWWGRLVEVRVGRSVDPRHRHRHRRRGRAAAGASGRRPLRVISGEVSRVRLGSAAVPDPGSDEPAPHHRRRQHEHGPGRPRGRDPQGPLAPHHAARADGGRVRHPRAEPLRRLRLRARRRSREWPSRASCRPSRRCSWTWRGRISGRSRSSSSPGCAPGMPILYEPPGDVGADRIVNGVAAFAAYGGPVIVVDFGTATTFDVVTEEGRVRRRRDLPGGGDQRRRALPARGAAAARGRPQPGARDRALHRGLDPGRASTSATPRWWRASSGASGRSSASRARVVATGGLAEIAGRRHPLHRGGGPDAHPDRAAPDLGTQPDPLTPSRGPRSRKPPTTRPSRSSSSRAAAIRSSSPTRTGC